MEEQFLMFKQYFALITISLLLAACSSSPTNKGHTDLAALKPTKHEFHTHVNSWHCFPLDESALDNTDKANRPLAPNDNLWLRLQDGLILEYVNNREVNAQINFYSKNAVYLERVQKRASPYLHFIIEALEQHDLPLDIALLPIVESAYQPFSYSHGQASGLWQFIPMTGNRFKLRQDWWYDGRRDVVESTYAAIHYLSYLHRFFDGDWLLALAAYNAGEGTVQRAMRANQRSNKPTDFWSLNLPKETRAYVPKMIALAEIFRRPEHYNVSFAYIPNTPHFSTIGLEEQIDLMQAAELAGISIDDLYYLNPGYNRWATPPGSHHTLKLPTQVIEVFQQALDSLPSNQRISWQRHIIQKGESLNSIAKKYQSNIAWIQEVNQLNSHVIVAGRTLMIPVSSANLSQYRLAENQRLASKQSRAPSQNHNKTMHTVQQGDTFWSIAKRYQVSVDSLARWNNKAPRDTLRIGEPLVVWTTQATPPSRAGKLTTINYRVRPGDSLAKIAQKFSVKVQDIVHWNQLDTKRYLQPGQALKLTVNIMNTSGQ